MFLYFSPCFRQVDTEKWDTVYQLVSTRQETVEVYLEEDNDLADLEAMASAGTGKRRPRVRVDLGGAEFFSMEQISAEFQAETGSTAGESRTQLGYRTTEEVIFCRLFFASFSAGQAHEGVKMALQVGLKL